MIPPVGQPTFDLSKPPGKKTVVVFDKKQSEKFILGFHADLTRALDESRKNSPRAFWRLRNARITK